MSAFILSMLCSATRETDSILDLLYFAFLKLTITKIRFWLGQSVGHSSGTQFLPRTMGPRLSVSHSMDIIYFIQWDKATGA